MTAHRVPADISAVSVFIAVAAAAAAAKVFRAAPA